MSVLSLAHSVIILLVASRDYLEHITSIGPRTTGSPENEILTVHYLLEQIKLIENQSHGLHKISVDVQRPTGSFSIDFLGGFTSYYDNITNVVVKLEPRDGAQHAVLANCHFDSVANSPGMFLFLVILKLSQPTKLINTMLTGQLCDTIFLDKTLFVIAGGIMRIMSFSLRSNSLLFSESTFIPLRIPYIYSTSLSINLPLKILCQNRILDV